MTKVLIYMRPYSAEVLCKAVSMAFNNPDIVTISEYQKIADYWIGDYIYSSSYDNCILSQTTINDVVCRDRALREMKPERAIRIIRRFWKGAEECFDVGHFDYFVTMTADCYCPDVLIRVAQRHGIQPISPMGTFLKGDYARFTLYGERVELGRSVSDQEVKKVMDTITPSAFLPKTEINNVQMTSTDAKKNYWRRWAIEHLYHPFKRLFSSDPDNPRWNTSLVSGNSFSCYYSDDYDEYFTPIDDIDFDARLTAYFPMHLIPEATTDYFCKNIAAEGYCNYVLRVAREKDANVTLLVKEHPAMFGRRKLQFYRDLASLPNVFVIHPFVRSNELLEKTDLVVVDNGTVGIESAIRGKRVLALEENYYSDLHPNIKVGDKVTANFFNFPICDYNNNLFIRDLLSSMFPSDYCDSGKLMAQTDAHALADGLVLLRERLQ